MSATGGIPSRTIIPGVILKEKVNKTEVANIVENVQKTGTITKAEFKALAGNIKGGNDSLGELLKGVIPADDLKKLKGFSFASNSSIKFSVDTAKTLDLKNQLGKIIDKLPDSGEDTSYLMLNRLKNDISGLDNKGDSIEKSAFVKVAATASIGASGEAADKNGNATTASWILGMTGTEAGVSGNIHAGGDLKASAEMLGEGKIKISFQVKIGVGAEAQGGIQALGVAGINMQGGADISKQKTVSYTFDSKDDAKAFLENKGKNFVQEGTVNTPPGTKNFVREDNGWDTVKEGSGNISSGFVPVKKTTNSSWNPFSFSLSKQTLSAKVSNSLLEGTVKTYSLDTKSGMLIFSKSKTTTEISIKSNPKGELTGGSMSMDVDLNKITNSKDKEATIKKLVDRYKHVQNQLPGNIKLDSSTIEAYVRGSIDKLIQNDGAKYYTPKDPAQSKTSAPKNDLRSLSQAAQIDVAVSAPTALSVSAEVHANWGNRVKLTIPLSADTSVAPPKKGLKVDGDDVIIQVFNTKGGSLGAGVSAGVGVASFGASLNVGMAVNKATFLDKGTMVVPPQPVQKQQQPVQKQFVTV